MPAPDRKIEWCRFPIALINPSTCIERRRDRRDIALRGGVVDGGGKWTWHAARRADFSENAESRQGISVIANGTKAALRY